MSESPGVQAAPQEVWERPFVRAHKEWCGAFVLELRLRDVPGPVIGERLGEVEGHCTETGESPSAAFGDPTEYAREIDAESSPERVSGVWTIAALGAGQVLAMLVGTAAIRNWVSGEPLTYNLVQLGCLAVVAAALLCLPRVLRPLMARPWVVGTALFALFAVVAAAGVGVAAASGTSSATVVPVSPAVIAIGLFMVVLALSWLEYRELTRDSADDLVTSPLAPEPRANVAAQRSGWIALLPALMIPTYYLAVGILSWVFG
ncbi:hypothetical protein O2W18_18275 [Modestobacter sp. VKM Ac-2983]|uniref:hypothetical protein n=1 Tax=Modestobacter sp. VKM Ac-2983 TaxID=3004137 RepID=UPI0022AB7568|nr:hypothetical protein [Modestobacter sp. VKM Ac-2983]MCZ2807058.1 hypothetical protein [Modestobacter sp. VKM Ac-2983]